MNPNTMNRIIKAVEYARKKHPEFAKTGEEAVCIAAEEFGEWAKEVNDLSHLERAEEEALHTIAVLVRFLEHR